MGNWQLATGFLRISARNQFANFDKKVYMVLRITFEFYLSLAVAPDASGPVAFYQSLNNQ